MTEEKQKRFHVVGTVPQKDGTFLVRIAEENAVGGMPAIEHARRELSNKKKSLTAGFNSAGHNVSGETMKTRGGFHDYSLDACMDQEAKMRAAGQHHNADTFQRGEVLLKALLALLHKEPEPVQVKPATVQKFQAAK